MAVFNNSMISSGGSVAVDYGNKDDSVSEHLKCYISNKGGPTISALLGEGSSMEMQSNWESPFESDSIGSMFERAGAIMQVFGGNTSKTTLNSTQVYQGNRPVSLHLVLHLYAYSDAQSEVEMPLKILRMMISPEPSANMILALSGNSQAPSYVSIMIGKKFAYPYCVLESISEPYDTKVDGAGNRLNAIVNVSASTIREIKRSEMAGMPG